MRALDRKLFRELWQIRGQVVTLSLVVACGIAGYVSMQGTWSSLSTSRDHYYRAYRFADVFATLERAPRRLRDSLESLPGVAEVELRIVESALLPIPDRIEPATATLVSLPPRPPALNDIHLVSGRRPEPGRDDEVVVSDGFAAAYALRPGASLSAVMAGTRRELSVVGVAMSPEFVFPTPPGQFMPDHERYAILWLNESSLSAIFQLDGAFNDVVLRLQPGVAVEETLTALDRALAPYGGLGAVPRARQISHFALSGELQQLETLATVVPLIFLGVAAFLLNVVLSRIILLQRPTIATLKAVGYGNWSVGLHYLELVTVVVALGSVIGLAAGAWLGQALTGLYADMFRFPILVYRLELRTLLIGGTVSLLAAGAGAVTTVRSVVALPPAEAMQPPAPARYRATVLERLGLSRWLGTSTMMIIRELRRRPLRFALSSVAIACGIGVMVVGRFSTDSLDYMLDVHLHEQQRAEMTVGLRHPVPRGVLSSIEALPGVRSAEGLRTVPVRMRTGNTWRDTALVGVPRDANLRQVITRDSQVVPLPSDGMILTDVLAKALGVGVGDLVDVDIKQGDWSTRVVRVAGVIDETFGMQGYLQAAALSRLMDEDPIVDQLYLRVDPLHEAELQARLADMPAVASVHRKQTIIDLYNRQTGETMGVMTLLLTLFAAIISIGVVYNNARVALSMRNRDLASLRVLGFTRREVSMVLLGELGLQIAFAVPLGLLIGRWWSFGIARTIDPETFRLPVVISGQTYALAVAVAIISGTVTAFLVRRKLDHLDLIGVLKTRE